MSIESTSIILSSSAIKRIQGLLPDQKSSFFRVYVTGGGCSGFQYDFSFTDKKNPDDDIYDEYQVKYLIDQSSIEFLSGGELDYVDELAGSYFKIENPNSTANCGCGTSFSI